MLGEDLARKDGRHGEYSKVKEGTYINPSEIPEFVWLLGVGNLMIICDNRNCLLTTICDEFLSKEKIYSLFIPFCLFKIRTIHRATTNESVAVQYV